MKKTSKNLKNLKKPKEKARKKVKYVPGRTRRDTQIKPGEVRNPNGRPKGSYSIYIALEKAIEEVQKKKKVNLLVHFVQEAFTSKRVLIALMKKILPDRQYVEDDPKLGEVINIIYGYRNRSRLPNSPVRDGQGREIIPTESNPAEGS